MEKKNNTFTKGSTDKSCRSCSTPSNCEKLKIKKSNCNICSALTCNNNLYKTSCCGKNACYDCSHECSFCLEINKKDVIVCAKCFHCCENETCCKKHTTDCKGCNTDICLDCRCKCTKCFNMFCYDCGIDGKNGFICEKCS